MLGKSYMNMNANDFSQIPNRYLYKAVFSERARIGGVLTLIPAVLLISSSILILSIYFAIRSYYTSQGLGSYSQGESEFIFVYSFLIIAGIIGIIGGISAFRRKSLWLAIIGSIFIMIGFSVLIYYDMPEASDVEYFMYFPVIYDILFLTIFGFGSLIMLIIGREDFNAMLLIRTKLFPPTFGYPPIQPPYRTAIEETGRVSILPSETQDGEVIRCPVCKEIFKLKSTQRPIEIKCPHCGAEGELS